jgi:hypothetical protein
MALLATQKAGPTGLVPNFVAAAGGGDTFVADGRTALIVKNGSGGSINVTITSKKRSSPGLAPADVVVAVAAAAEKHILVGQSGFADPVSGAASVAYSSAVTVTVAAVRY